MDNVAIKVAAETGSFVRGFSDVTRSLGLARTAGQKFTGVVDGLDQSIKNIGQKAAGLGAGMVVTSLGFVKAASDIEGSMRNVNSIMRGSEDQFRQMTKAVIDLSKIMPQTAKQNADALYDIASAGYVGADALTILKVAGTAATAGLTDTSTAATAIIASLKSYGQGVSKATDVSDILFQTVNKGILTFPELAQGMGDWVNMAANAKVPLEQATSALATMTLAGMKAPEAATATARVMESFLKPSDAMKAAVSELGYASAQAMLSQIGLANSIGLITQSSGGSSEVLGALFQDVRGLNGVMALGADNGKLYKDTIAGIADPFERAGAAQLAFDEQQKSLNSQMQITKNNVTAMAAELGGYLLPVFEDGNKTIWTFAHMFESIPGPIKGAIAGIMLFGGAIIAVSGFLLMSKARLLLFKTGIQKIAPDAAKAVEGINSISRSMVTMAVQSKLAQKYGPDIGLQKAQKFAQYSNTFAGAMKHVATAGAAALTAWTVVQSISDGINSAGKARSQKFIDSLGTPQDYNDRANAFNKLNDEYERNKAASAPTLGNNLKIAVGMANPFNKDVTAEQRAAANDQEAILKEQSEKLENYRQNVEKMHQATGMSETAIVSLAGKANVDLYAGFDKAGTAAAMMAGRMGNEIPDSAQGAVASMIRFANSQDRTTASTKELLSQWRTLHNEIGQGIEIDMSPFQKSIQGALQAIGGSDLKGVIQDRENLLKMNQDSHLKDIDKQKKAAQDASDAYVKGLNKKDDKTKASKKATQDAIDSEKDRLDTQLTSLDKAADKWNEYKTTVTLSLDDTANALNDQTAKAKKYGDDLETFANRLGKQKNIYGFDMYSSDEIAKIKKYLTDQGADGVQLLDQMNNAKDDQFGKIVDAINNNLKATDASAAVNIDAAMTVAQKVGEAGAGATAEAIANALGLKEGEFTTVGTRWGIALVNGLVDAAKLGPSGGGDPFFNPFKESNYTLTKDQVIGSFNEGSHFQAKEIAGKGMMYAADGGGPWVLEGGELVYHPELAYNPYPTGKAAGGVMWPGKEYITGDRGMEKITMGLNGAWVTPLNTGPTSPMREGNTVSGSRAAANNPPSHYSVTNRTVFMGDMVMTDPKAAIRYADRRKRTAALSGVN